MALRSALFITYIPVEETAILYHLPELKTEFDAKEFPPKSKNNVMAATTLKQIYEVFLYMIAKLIF